MELVYLVLLLAAVVAMNWRFVGFDRLFAPRGCRWRRDPTRPGAPSVRYVCAACGAEAYRPEGAPPKACARGSRRR